MKFLQAVLIAFSFYASQITFASEGRMELAIDYSALSDEEIGLVNKFLIEVQPTDDYFKHKVSENENLYTIIQNYTRYSDGASPKSVINIADAVAKASDIANVNLIRRGQTINIPALPVRPFREGASFNRYQQFNLETKELAVCSSAGCDLEGLPNTLVDSQRKNLADAGTLSVSIDNNEIISSTEIEQLLSTLGAKAILIPTGYVEIELLQDKSELKPTMVKSNVPAASVLKPASLYLMDQFSEDSCEHGDLVEDVVINTLSHLGVWDDLKTNIHKLELDFWKNPTEGISIIRSFIDSDYSSFFAKERYENELNKIKQDINNNSIHKGIPSLYLRALLAKVEADQGLPILSASFWVRDQGMRIFPLDHRFYDRTFIFAATPNLVHEIESSSLPEPQNSIYLSSSPYSALVTAFDHNLTITSMFSRDGTGIEFIDLGTVTGKFGKCKDQEAHGSSFATPKIAALVYNLAKSEPRNRIIRRILLSSDIREEFIDKVQAPGSPRLDLVNLDSGIYGIGINGLVNRLTPTIGQHSLTMENIKLPFGIVESDNPSIAGVFFGTKETYVFRESLWRWVPAELSSFNIVTNDGILRIDELKQKYKGVIAL